MMTDLRLWVIYPPSPSWEVIELGIWTEALKAYVYYYYNFKFKYSKVCNSMVFYTRVHPCNHRLIQGLEDFQHSRRLLCAPSQSVHSHEDHLYTANLGTFMQEERVGWLSGAPCWYL